MDAARYAGMSDPDLNPSFRRRWDAPPLKLKRPPMGGTIERAGSDYTVSSNENINRIFEKFKNLVEAKQ